MYISPDDIDIVIVRYKETLKWLEYWDSPCPNIYVYNKYLDFSDIVDELTRERLGDALRIYNIENIGHEGSTYMYHILMFFRLRYPFKKITIFLQGNPFPHFSPLLKITPQNFQRKLMEAATYVQISKPTFAAPLFTTPHREKWDEFPGMNLSLHFNDLFAPVDLTDSFIAPSPVTSLSYTFSAGCQYIVPKYVLISRTVEFYKHIARCLKRGVNIKLDELRRRRNYEYGEIDGWTMERLFAFIWNIKYEANPV